MRATTAGVTTSNDGRNVEFWILDADVGRTHVRLVIVTGVSGAGKSTALNALEDLGYYCADNMPLPLLPKFVELLSARGETERAALGIDARSGDFLAESRPILAGIRDAGHRLEILFLDAPDDVLIRRFSETRRRHPLRNTDIRGALVAERAQLAPMRQQADAVIDTGALTMHSLRALIQERHTETGGRLSVTMMSFGFKHGLPTEADIVLDVRFLPNPFFVKELAPLTGEDEAVRRFVLEAPDTAAFLEKAEALLRLSLLGFAKEGKSHATIAIGCTGGQHRSVAVVAEMARRFAENVAVSVRHRDIGRGGGA
jgi:RNase adapter protein RapZ